MRESGKALAALQLQLAVLCSLLAASSCATCNATTTRVFGYSRQVQFYHVSGSQVLRPVVLKADTNSFVCQYLPTDAESRVSYSLKVLRKDSSSSGVSKAFGRVAQLVNGDAIGATCIVTVRTSNCSEQQHWNVMIVAGRSSDSSRMFSSRNWLQAASLSVTSNKKTPRFSDSNSVKCSVQLLPSRGEFAQLQLRRDGVLVATQPPTFSTFSSGVRQELRYSYRPLITVENFTCVATDPLALHQLQVSKLIKYQGGVSEVKVFSSKGFAVTNNTEIEQSDELECRANVALPAVTFHWRVLIGSAATRISGQRLKLSKINLYYPLCCVANNTYDGHQYTASACLSLRGNASFHTAVMLDKPGQRIKVIGCNQHSKMGLLQVRYSKLQCNGRRSSSSSSCNTAKCTSKTALQEISRLCATQRSSSRSCRADGTYLMSGFMTSALRRQDAIDSTCFSWSNDGVSGAPGVVKIELDYFCTAPKAWQLSATGSGRLGRVQTFRVATSGCYSVEAAGAAGGNHTTGYGTKGPGNWTGGRGALMTARFYFKKGAQLSVVVGQHGGNSSERSASARHAGSIEDNAGTGGGGGTFVYRNAALFLAAGGGGGASYGYDGVPGQQGENGTDSVGASTSKRGTGGVNGFAGFTNTRAASYHGGCGAGWYGRGPRRKGPEHGAPGRSRRDGWAGGLAGRMNQGAVGGFGGGGGGSEDNGASGAGGGFSGGGAGTHDKQAGGGGGSFCNATLAASCSGTTAGNVYGWDGYAAFYLLGPEC